MPLRDPAVSLRQMRDAARRAIKLIESRSQRDLEAHDMLDLALVRLLEVLGEAANRIPPAEQGRHPGIPWAEIVGLRNRLIHGYDQIDLDVVWQIVTVDLPALVHSLDAALAVYPSSRDDG
jgi:uncharacterized protein with HEPN domain